MVPKKIVPIFSLLMPVTTVFGAASHRGGSLKLGAVPERSGAMVSGGGVMSDRARLTRHFKVSTGNSLGQGGIIYSAAQVGVMRTEVTVIGGRL